MQRNIATWIIGILVFAGCTWFVYWAATAPTNTDTIQGSEPMPAITETDWMKGTLDENKVQIVEYSDFQCPGCAAYRPLLEEVYEKYSDQVVIVYRHFPLPKHQNATIAAQSAQAAGAQGKFWEMHDRIFENQNTWDDLSRAEAKTIFEGYAQELGLDMAKFTTDYGAEETAKVIAEQFVTGAKAGIQGTPSIFINGALLKENPTSIEKFSQIITNAQN